MSDDGDWYVKGILDKWHDPKVKTKILVLLTNISDDGSSEDLDEVDEAVFGPRIEHKECGSKNLPGAPVCWGCEEKL